MIEQETGFHPVADIFPLMSSRELNELAADIRRNGLREPIWTHDGLIVDGRNRYRACEIANVIPDFREWDGDGSLVSFVVSLNLHRRHLDESQRAMVAAKIATLEHGSNQHASIEAPSQAQAAEMLNVGRSSVQRAREVIEQGAPELVEAVQQGEISVSAAADFTELPEEIQREVVAQVATGEKTVSEIKRSLLPLMSSETDEWYTPPEIVQMVVATLGEIDVDPCAPSGKPTIPASTLFRKEDDGLSNEWRGRVYMNPPYGREISEWVSKLVAEYNSGRTTEAIALVPARVDTEWFRQFREFAVCFVYGRLKFSGHDNSAPFPSAAIYLGVNRERFLNVFSEAGDIWVRLRG